MAQLAKEAAALLDLPVAQTKIACGGEADSVAWARGVQVGLGVGCLMFFLGLGRALGGCL